ncbi:MAG: cyclic nucleotide-binding domain-containing protein [Desulfuromusa sp.]|nr:cyclic nucleotide-binding domain-containing protein [Desulfuromusa sp.]
MNPFWNNIFRDRGYEKSLAYFLSSMPMFKDLEKRELAFLEHIVHVRNYEVNETIFSEGDIGSGMYTIRSGQVQIYTLDEHGLEIDQAILGAGDFFGEIALTASRPRCASARATETTVLIGLFRTDLLEAVRRSPAPSAKIMLGLNRVVSDRLLQCSCQLEEVKEQLADNQKQHTNE